MQSPVEMTAGFELPNELVFISGTVIMIEESENSCQILAEKKQNIMQLLRQLHVYSFE